MSMATGYVVLDQGMPVRRDGSTEGTFFYTYPASTKPISVFPTKNLARSAKAFIQGRYREMANRFDPKKGVDEERCFDLWRQRSESILIRPIAIDTAPNFRRSR